LIIAQFGFVFNLIFDLGVF